MTDSSLVAALKDELRKIDAELAPLEEEVRRLAARVTPLADRRHWLEKTIEEASALFPDPAKAIAGASLAQQREGFIDNGCCVSCRSDGEQCAATSRRERDRWRESAGQSRRSSTSSDLATRLPRARTL
jgi:hypothetical protein